MSEFIRFINHNIQNFIISQIEKIGNSYDNFLQSSPNSLRDGKFQRILCSLFKEFSNGFVCRKSFDQRKDIVLQYHNRGCRNLRSKVVGLTFTKAKKPLAFLEDYFQGPSLGVNFVCFKELQLRIRCDSTKLQVQSCNNILYKLIF